MNGSHSAGLHRNLRAIFDSGTCTGLSDGQLIERYVNRFDPGSQLAFETLVARHGPMVLRVCRGIVRDSHEAQDACQAVFLVLARRAKAIRNRDFLAGWLYRIAVRMAHRQRTRAHRGFSRGGLTLNHNSCPDEVAAHPEMRTGDFDDSADIVHQEVERLETKLREPVILCYFEGLTHDEAGERLGWPVGTVRSRLARARDRLRGRLSRRGVTGRSLGIFGTWIDRDPGTPLDAAYARLTDLVAPLPPNFVKATLEAASRFTSPAPVKPAAIPASFTVLSLARGALLTMFLEKLTISALALVPVGLLVVGAGTMYGQISRPDRTEVDAPAAKSDAVKSERRLAQPPVNSPPAPPTAASATTKDPVSLDEKSRLLDILAAAKKRVEFQKPAYEAGRITIDRFIDACIALADAEKAVADDSEQEMQAQLRSVGRIEDILKREQAELIVGKGTQSDVSEAEEAFERVSLELARLQGDDIQFQNQVQKARARYETQKTYREEGRISIDRYLDAIVQLGEAEKAVSKTPQERIAAQQRCLKLVDETLTREKADLEAGTGTIADVSEIELRKLQVELELSRLERISNPKPRAASARSPRRQLAEDHANPNARTSKSKSMQVTAGLYRQYLTSAEEIFEARKDSYLQGHIDPEPYARACEDLARAQQRIARTDSERRDSQAKLIERLREIENSIREDVAAGTASQLELAVVTERKLSAEIDLETGARAGDRAELIEIKARLNKAETRLDELTQKQGMPVKPTGREAR